MQSGIKEFYCYRRYLAQFLFAQGFKGEKVPNVMEPDKTAWSFPLSTELAQTIRGYYISHDLKVPRMIDDYLSEHDGEGETGNE